MIGSLLISCYYSIHAVNSFLPYHDQKMAGFVTILAFSYILVFFVCAFSLGVGMTIAGILLRFAGTRKGRDASDPSVPIVES